MEVTAGSSTDKPVDELPEPQAMEVSAGSSTDEPASSYIGLFDQYLLERLAAGGRSAANRHPENGPILAIDEKPIYHGAATSILQLPDTHFHPQVTAGYGPVPFPEYVGAPVQPWSSRGRDRLMFMPALSSSSGLFTTHLGRSNIMRASDLAPTFTEAIVP